jgi:ABC-type uncharacterized transport system ATPase subunit
MAIKIRMVEGPKTPRNNTKKITVKRRKMQAVVLLSTEVDSKLELTQEVVALYKCDPVDTSKVKDPWE